MAHHGALLLLTFLSVTCTLNGQLLEGLYCGKENCYDVLGVERDISKVELGRKYRQLARKYHPDLQRTVEGKREAEERFKQVAAAYEFLKDEESRADYDYMLDNPEEYYAHYYRYYRRRVAPKVDVRIVIIVTISIISVIQYYSAWQRYESAIKYFMTVPKYRNCAMDIAQQQGLINEQKRTKGKSKAELKEETETIIRNIIENKMDIKGAYAKPKVSDILWLQLLIFPYTVLKYIVWYILWVWNHTIRKKPFSDEEKLYLIRRYLKIGQHQFDAIEESEKHDYLMLELWIKENFEKWHKEKEQNMKKQMAENTRYKQYRRYMKNHGVGRMTFED